MIPRRVWYGLALILAGGGVAYGTSDIPGIDRLHLSPASGWAVLLLGAVLAASPFVPGPDLVLARLFMAGDRWRKPLDEGVRAFERGELTEARTSFEKAQAVAAKQKSWAGQLRALSWLSATADVQDPAQAIDYSRAALEAATRFAGPHHPRTRLAREVLIGRLLAAGRKAEADPLLEENIRHLDPKRRLDFEDYLWCLTKQGELRLELDNPIGAREAFERLRGIAADIFGPTAPEVVPALVGLARLARASGDEAAAERLLQDAYANADMRGDLSARHTAAEPLTQLLLDQGRAGEARDLLERWYRAAASASQRERDQVRLMRLRVATLRAVGDTDEAEVLERRATLLEAKAEREEREMDAAAARVKESTAARLKAFDRGLELLGIDQKA